MSDKYRNLDDLNGDDLNKIMIREMKYGELAIILARFHIMLSDNLGMQIDLTEDELDDFIRGESWRRDLYISHCKCGERKKYSLKYCDQCNKEESI